MNDLRKAAGEALEALEALEDVPYMSNKDDYERLERVKTALRQVLVDADDISENHVDETVKSEHEPVAWANSFDLQNFDMKVRTCPDLHHTVPLYTALPKRTWVGLTAYEIQEIHSRNQHWGNFACAIEAKLKEKNHG